MEVLNKKWKDTALLLVLLFFVIFSFIINRNIRIDALYGDDLYLWSYYGEENFLEFTFPLHTKGNLRPVYWAIAYIEFFLAGHRVFLYGVFNKMLNALIAFQLFLMVKKFSSSGQGLLSGTVFLFSSLSLYQIGQVLGLLEALAIIFSTFVLYFLILYEDHGRGRDYFLAEIFFLLVIFTHERFVVLYLLFPLSLLIKRSSGKIWKMLTISLILLVFLLLRANIAGEMLPRGTAGTSVSDTFNISQAFSYALQQLLYIFSVNPGPDYQSGISFSEAPLLIKLSAVLSIVMIFLEVLFYILGLLKRRGKSSADIEYPGASADTEYMSASADTEYQASSADTEYMSASADTEYMSASEYSDILIFLMFTALSIGAGSVTVRLEMRWVYVSLYSSLLFLGWMTGRSPLDKRRIMEKIFILYIAFYLPVQGFYRSYRENVYFSFSQDRVNSLKELTIGDGGIERVRGKKIYIYYNIYGMTDFYAEYFFKPFDPEKTGQGARIEFINSPWEIEEDDDPENTFVLMESEDGRGYRDKTEESFRIIGRLT